jgi:hypothetical protein
MTTVILRNSAWCVAVAALLSMCSLPSPLLAQGKAATAAGQKGVGDAADAPTAKVRGRLPPYFKDIVDEAQRTEIYKLQGTFNGKIAALQQQIEQLEAERDAAVEGVLTAEQKTVLETARATGSAKRKKGRAAPTAEAAAAETGKSE